MRTLSGKFSDVLSGALPAVSNNGVASWSNNSGAQMPLPVGPQLGAPWKVYGWGVTLIPYWACFGQTNIHTVVNPNLVQIARFADIWAALSSQPLPSGNTNSGVGAGIFPVNVLDLQRVYNGETDFPPPRYLFSNSPPAFRAQNYIAEPLTFNNTLATPLTLNSGDQLYLGVFMAGLLAAVQSATLSGLQIQHGILDASYNLVYDIASS